MKIQEGQILGFGSLPYNEMQKIVEAVKIHTKYFFTFKEVEAALFISDTSIVMVDGIFRPLIEAKFFYHLSLVLKGEMNVEMKKDIASIEEQLITEGFNILSEAIIKNFVRGVKCNPYINN